MSGKLSKLVEEHSSGVFEKATNENHLAYLYRMMCEEISGKDTDWEAVRQYTHDIQAIEDKE